MRHAFQNGGVATRISGVVTLATPFISITLRSYVEWLKSVTKEFAASALVASFLILGFLLFAALFYFVRLFDARVGQVRPFFQKLANPEIGEFVLAPCVFTIFGVLRWIYLNRIGRFLSAVESKLSGIQREMIGVMDPPIIEGIPLLSIEVHADEARLALAASDLFSEWTHKTLGSRHANNLAMFVMLPVLTMYLFHQYQTDLLMYLFDWPYKIFGLSSFKDILLLYMTSLAVVFLVVTFLIGSLLSLSIVIPRAVKAPIFGEETIFETWLFQSARSAVPNGWMPDTHRSFVVQSKWWHSWKSLRHSLVYQNPAVTEYVANWIKALLLHRGVRSVIVHRRSDLPPARTNFDGLISGVVPRLWGRKYRK